MKAQHVWWDDNIYNFTEPDWLRVSLAIMTRFDLTKGSLQMVMTHVLGCLDDEIDLTLSYILSWLNEKQSGESVTSVLCGLF
jgi:hypothetical protein